MSEPRYTAMARQDLRDIWDDRAQYNPDAADQLLEEIRAAAQLHASQRGMGRKRDDLKPGYKSFVIKRYVIFFRLVDDTIEVLRVLPGRKDVDSIMKQS